MTKHAPLFHAEVAKLGIQLEANVKLPWLTRHGHLAPLVQQSLPPSMLSALDEILAALDGDAEVLAAKTRGSMTADFLLMPQRIQVEYDEVQHFTSARAVTLEHYPGRADLAFDPKEYAATVTRWRTQGDRGFAHKEAAEFAGRGGRQRQRAYFDAFRDLAAAHFGNGPMLRVAAPANDYGAAAARLANMIEAAGIDTARGKP
jgi:hypothetical protein